MVRSTLAVIATVTMLLALSVTTALASPPIEADLFVNPKGSVQPKTGTIEIRGTITCSAPTVASIDVFVEQIRGRVIIFGFGFAVIACDGPTPFSVTAPGFNGLFTGGKAEVQAFSVVCDEFTCSHNEVLVDVILTGKP